MGYTEIADAADQLLTQRHRALEELEKRHEEEIHALEDEIEQAEHLLTTAREMANDFGGADIPAAPAGAGSSAPGPSTPPVEPPLAPGGRATGEAQPRGGRAERAIAATKERTEKILQVLLDTPDDGWAAPAGIIAAAPMPRKAYQDIVRRLVFEDRVEEKGTRATLRFRHREHKASGSKPAAAAGDDDSSSTPPPPAPPPPPKQPPAPKAPPVSHGTPEEPGLEDLTSLQRRALDHIERHPNETSTECARGLGLGTQTGGTQVANALLELAKLDLIDQAPNATGLGGGGVLWRRRGMPKPAAPAAPVQTRPGGSTGETSPKTDAERSIIHAIKNGTRPLTVGEIAEESDLPDSTVGAIVPSLCQRKVLQRGLRGTIPTFGLNPA